MHWIGAKFCVCMFLGSRHKYLNMFQIVSGFQLQYLRGFSVHILVKYFFFGPFILLRIPQQANIASCSGFRNCKWIPPAVKEFRNLFITELAYALAEFKSKDSSIVHEQFLKHWLTKSIDVTFFIFESSFWDHNL